jgi:predicted SAM-dependent methyltransferase
MIFDFSDLKDDWNYIVNGKYSLIQDHLKQKILRYFNNNSANHIYIQSYLFPDFFMEEYAVILNVSFDLLRSVGELCSKPDLEKEKLLIGVGDLENIKILD